MSETSSMERARCEAAAAPRNDSAGGAAGWTALRAPESREKCEMLYAYACHVCGPVNLTGETRTGTCNKSHTPSEPRSFFLRKIIRNIAALPGGGCGGAAASRRGGQEGVGGVSGAVAQAMRGAGCPNRRSLGYK